MSHPFSGPPVYDPITDHWRHEFEPCDTCGHWDNCEAPQQSRHQLEDVMVREGEAPPVKLPDTPQQPDVKEAAAHAEDGAERVISEPEFVRGDIVPEKEG